MARRAKTGVPAESVLDYPPFRDILQRLDRLPRQQRRVADAMLQSPELIAFHSVRDVAGRVGTNNATIVRFAQSFGYNGYPEFQAAVRLAYLQHTGATPGTGKSTAALRSANDSVAFTRGQQRTNLEIAQTHFENAAVADIAACIAGARRVIIYAEAGAEPSGLLFARLLRQVQVLAEVVTSSGDSMIALHDSGAQDVLIMLSLSITFRSSVTAMKVARRSSVPIVAIVGNENSPLVRDATYTLKAPSSSAVLWYSSVAFVAIIELLVALIAAERSADTLVERQTMYDTYMDEQLLASFEAEKPAE